MIGKERKKDGGRSSTEEKNYFGLSHRKLHTARINFYNKSLSTHRFLMKERTYTHTGLKRKGKNYLNMQFYSQIDDTVYKHVY